MRRLPSLPIVPRSPVWSHPLSSIVADVAGELEVAGDHLSATHENLIDDVGWLSPPGVHICGRT